MKTFFSKNNIIWCKSSVKNVSFLTPTFNISSSREIGVVEVARLVFSTCLNYTNCLLTAFEPQVCSAPLKIESKQ